jgi:hypothetical protein
VCGRASTVAKARLRRQQRHAWSGTAFQGGGHGFCWADPPPSRAGGARARTHHARPRTPPPRPSPAPILLRRTARFLRLLRQRFFRERKARASPARQRYSGFAPPPPPARGRRPTPANRAAAAASPTAARTAPARTAWAAAAAWPPSSGRTARMAAAAAL